MRIVHISTFDALGGAARAAYRLHTGLRRLGHQSSMVVSRKITDDSDVVRFMPRRDLLSRMRHRQRRRRMKRDFAPYLSTRPPGYELFSDDRTEFGGELVDLIGPCDVINLHWTAGLLDYEGFFSRLPRGIPIVWRLADMGALTGGCHYDDGCGKFAAQCGACPQLGSRDPNDLSHQGWARRDASVRLVPPGDLHLVATSRWIAGQARRSSLLGERPITIIPNGLDVASFSPRDQGFAREALGIAPDARVVMFVADSVENRRKGFAYLAEALAGIAEAQKILLLSIGGGKPQLDSRVPLLHLGRVDNERLLSIAYSAADVFVIPSLQESFGQTVIESLACGTPVVGFDAGGIPDMVRPGLTGYLAPVADAAGLRDAILKVIGDPDARRRMGEQCRQVAVQEYSFDVQAAAYVRLYQSLIKGDSTPRVEPGLDQMQSSRRSVEPVIRARCA
jgi:glycosyltransferase involved in cell wall biosynthesis